MSVYKRWKGQKITSKHPKYAEARWVCYKRINGRTIHKSIPEARTKDQAEAAERKLTDDLFNRKYGIADTETTFGSFAEEKYKPYYQQHNVNTGAKRLYVDLLNKHWKGRPLIDITPQDCRNVQDRLRRKMSDSSTNRVMSTASKIFSLACEEGILDRNPMQYVKSLKEPPPRSRLLTPEEKERLWKELENDRLLMCLITLATNLPLRRGQLLALTPDAIDLPNGRLYAISSKGRPPRLVPLNSTATSILTRMIAERLLPFPLKDFRKRWKRAFVSSGINSKDGKRGENFTFHDLRKEFASELIRNNVNPNVVQKLFAHSDMSITNVYMHSELDDLKAAVNTLDATILPPTQEIDGPPN